MHLELLCITLTDQKGNIIFTSTLGTFLSFVLYHCFFVCMSLVYLDNLYVSFISIAKIVVSMIADGIPTV